MAEPKLKRIRDAHHLVARCFAQGMTAKDIKLKTGYSEKRLSFFRNDPDFQKLIESYSNKIKTFQDEVDKNGYTSFVAVREEATNLLLERLLNAPGTLPTPLIADISLKYGDRTGLAPINRTVSGTVDLNKLAESLARGRERADRLSIEKNQKPNQEISPDD